MRLLARLPKHFGFDKTAIPAWLLSRLDGLCGPVRGLLASAGVGGDGRGRNDIQGSGHEILIEVDSSEKHPAAEPQTPVWSDRRDGRSPDEELSLEDALSRTLAHLGEAAEYLAGILDFVDELDEEARTALLDACRYFAEVREFLEEE